MACVSLDMVCVTDFKVETTCVQPENAPQLKKLSEHNPCWHAHGPCFSYNDDKTEHKIEAKTFYASKLLRCVTDSKIEITHF